jgi:uncharacterized protein (DUF1778 family)
VRCRVTASEEAVLEAAAKRLELPLATFVRDAALKAARREENDGDARSIALGMRNFLAELQRIALPLRRRQLAPSDMEKMVRELQRLQILILRLHQSVSES